MRITGFKIAFLLFTVLFLGGCAGQSVYMKRVDTLLEPTSEKALVRFMRPSGYSYGVNFNILDGETVIGNSVAKSQFDYLADPGEHVFIATAENKVFMQANLEAGKTYYVITRVYTGVWTARVAFIAVNKTSELWDKVKEYENILVKNKPDKVAIMAWQTKNRFKIKKLMEYYNESLKQTFAWPRLNPEDGR